MQADGSFTTNGCGLDGPTILRHHQQRDHPRLWEIDLVNRLAGLINRPSLRKSDLLEFVSHQFEHFAGQSREQPIVLMAKRRSVAQMGSYLPPTGNTRRAAVGRRLPISPCPRARSSFAVGSPLKKRLLKNLSE